MVDTKVLSSTAGIAIRTVIANQHIRMVSDGSRDIEDWRNGYNNI